MKTLKQVSAKQEKTIAKLLGGKQVPASGALWGAKGDVSTKYFLLECKFTKGNYYTLTSNVWLKIDNEARQIGKIPVIYVETPCYSFCAISYNDAQEINSDFVRNKTNFKNIEGIPEELRKLSTNIKSQKRVTWELIPTDHRYLIVPHYLGTALVLAKNGKGTTLILMENEVFIKNIFEKVEGAVGA